MTILDPIKTFGCMTVYRRKPKPFAAKSFVVYDTRNNRALEEFQRLKPALKWAESNRNG